MNTLFKVGDIVRINRENEGHFIYNSLPVKHELIVYQIDGNTCKLKYQDGTKFATGEGFYMKRFELVIKKSKEQLVLEKIKYLNDKHKNRKPSSVGLGNKDV